MGQKKLIRFAEIKNFDNVLEYPQDIKGNWHKHFGNNNPIVLELACGRGEYAVGLARLHPEKNFIGVDVKGNRMWVGAKKALNEKLGNVAFLRTQIEMIHNYFAEDEVAEIWITFPDPQLRISKAKKRLTHPRFLRLYKHFLQPNGIVHLKTDSPDLHEFTKKVINLLELSVYQDIDDVYALETVDQDLRIQTHYEKLDIAQSNRIHYLQFALDKPLPEEIDDELKQLISEESID
jgi:tRNA (guanine-N7-)-methyltransferase